WETVVERYPTDSPAFTHSNLAAGYSLNGRLEDALREYDAAIALSSPAPEAHNGKGTILFDLGKKEEAIQEFKTAIALDPYYAGPHRNLARAYHLMGMDKEAQEEMGLAQSLENRDGQ
ncbi:MAG TPA: tetratricopeptide repeat protein, partial [bacterium]|nr:tetratricopeptide repeat protein [bacterium]